jgi:hypothetical protein
MSPRNERTIETAVDKQLIPAIKEMMGESGAGPYTIGLAQNNGEELIKPFTVSQPGELRWNQHLNKLAGHFAEAQNTGILVTVTSNGNKTERKVTLDFSGAAAEAGR